jgi:hypothetical protein
MPSIGPITIPDPVDAGTWPLVPDRESSVIIQPKVTIHRFGATNAKVEQRFLVGPPLRQFRFVKRLVSKTDMDSLLSFWETAKGPYSIFDYTHYSKDGSTTYKVRFADRSMSWEFVSSCISSTGVSLIEVQTASPSHTVAATVDRFPSGGLSTALLSQVQELIPLVKITATDGTAIYLSDRLATVGGQRHEPRILQWSGISQSLGESSDQATFTLGNADDVFTDLVASVDLTFARLEFSLYHVQSQNKINLWTGFLNADGAWSIDEQNATMEIRATDGLATTTAAYPPRTIAQSCWKEFNDGKYCPASTAGGTNLGTACDKGWDTAAGCVHHSMQAYFGGVKVQQQLVQLTAKSFFGLKSSTLSASSVINDAATGRPLKEVYTDIAMSVPCDVIAARDESEFRAGLGIIGAGPIGAINPDLTQNTLDGVGPHGGITGLGFRFIPGNDPIVDTTKERMGLDEASSGWNPPSGTPYAAGVAAIQVRRTDQKGIQGFRVSDFQMQASVSQGIGGWKWTAVGSRSWVSGLTNNVWIAVNAWLKVNGAWCDSAHSSSVAVGVMEGFFDVDAAIAAATVCDASVTPIIGSGSETQFKFCGIVGDQKPFRQWLQIILDGALCDYTFRNGKLRIYARINASSASGFGLGNTLFRSVRAEARVPRFNHLTVEFGDSEFRFERNAVSLYDETHAKRRAPSGGMAAYTRQTMQPAGVVTKSQAARLNITLLREELGGTTAAEQKAARNVSWSSTVLALEVEPGMVCSFTGFRKLADGTKARVTRWTLNPDYSITFAGSTVVDSIYDYATGPKPVDVLAGSPDVERAPAIKYRRWFPNAVAPDAADPTYDEYNLSFDAGISYETLKDGSKRAILNVQGLAHVNTLLAADPPQVRTIAFTSTGGSLEGTHPLYVCVAPYDSSGRRGPRSRTLAIHLDAATSTCQVVLSNITWPSGTWTGYLVYAGREERAMCLYQSSTGTPSSITINGPERVATEGPPEAGDLGYRVKAKELFVPGVIKAVVSSLPSTTKAVCDALAGGADYTDETVMVIGDASNGFPPLRTFTVSSYDTVTGEFTFDRAHNGTDPLQTGDTLVVLARATSSTSTTVACSGLSMPTDGYIGGIVRLIGPGGGQFRRIASNTGTTITIDTPWDANPDTTTFFIVESGDWQYQSETSAAGITLADKFVSLRLPLENFEGKSILAMGFLLDAEGTEGFEDIAPYRIVEVVGSEGVAPGNDPPGPIRNLAVGTVDYDTDPGFALVPVTWDPPTTPNSFDRIQFWLSADNLDPSLMGELPHPVGSAGAGSGTLRIAQPTAADWTNPILWGASGSVSYQNSLITDVGVTQTPNVALDDIPYVAGASAGTPTAPDAVALTVNLEGDTFSLATSWTPNASPGGTTKWGREVRYFSDSACTTPDSDWIPLGEIYGAGTTAADTDYWPRPAADQWVLLRVRGLNWQDNASAWTTLGTGVKLDLSAGGYESPNAPSACSVSIVGREDTFALQIVITPPSPLGGTAGYDREARFYNDAGLTTPDSDWISLGWVDDVSTTSVTAFWPRPQANQWVKVRVRGTNWNGDVTSWVESAAAAALTPIATPPAPASVVLAINSKSDNGVPKFGFTVTVTPNASPGSTDWYEAQVRFWNDVGLTSADSDWIPIAGISPAQLTIQTDFWDRPAATQYVKVRVAGKNANGTLGSWTESTVQTITASSGLNAGQIDTSSIDATNFVIAAGKLDLPASAISAFELAAAAVTNAKIAADAVDSSKIAAATIVAADIASATILGTNIAAATIVSNNIQDGTIVGLDIAAATIAASNIVSGTITATQIASATITSTQIQDATITGTDIASATVTGANIGSLTITSANIAAATITASEIADASITGLKIASATIAADNIAASTITAAQIANNTLTSAKIADGTITAADIASLTITASQISNLTITAAQITDLTINGTKITDGAITNPKVTTGTLSGDKLQNATVTGTQIASATITGSKIGSATIAGSNIGSGTITGTNLATGTITATQIAALTITANEIANLTITSGKIASITADKIAAGTISASITITSPTITSPNISVTGSDYTVAINTVNAVQVTGTFSGTTTRLTSQGCVVQDSSGRSASHSATILSLVGSAGRCSLNTSINASIAVQNSSLQGWEMNHAYLLNSQIGAYINMNGTSQYVVANQYRWGSASLGTESIALSGITTSRVAYAFDAFGNYIGKIPIF